MRQCWGRVGHFRFPVRKGCGSRTGVIASPLFLVLCL